MKRRRLGDAARESCAARNRRKRVPGSSADPGRHGDLDHLCDNSQSMNDELTVMRSVWALVDEYRATCLWFLREDYYPQTSDEARRVLEQIERHGDVEAFRKAAELRQWLLRNSSAPSAV